MKRGFLDTSIDYNKDWFIMETKKKFGDKYSFEKTEYVNIRKDVIITCETHGDFKIRPHALIRQNAYCEKCKYIHGAEKIQIEISKLNPNFKIEIESFKGNSKICNIKNTETNQIIKESPYRFLYTLKQKLDNQKKRVEKKIEFEKLKILKNEQKVEQRRIKDLERYKEIESRKSTIIPHVGYDLSKSSLFDNKKVYKLKNIFCVKHDVFFTANLSTFNNSHTHGCQKCKLENYRKTTWFKDMILNKFKKTSIYLRRDNLNKNIIIDNEKFFIKNKNKESRYVFNCSKHGVFNISGTALNILLKNNINRHICKECYLNDNNIEILYPELLKDWDYKKNIFSPTQITKGFSKPVFWNCHRCHNDFKCIVPQKIKLMNGCPHCSLKTSSKIERIIFYRLQQIFEHKNVLHNDYIRYGISKKDKFSYDILITNIVPKLIIEYDGSFFHNNKLSYDTKKNIKINKAGYTSLRIRENPLPKTQSHDITYDFIPYDSPGFDSGFTVFFHQILNYIKDNFEFDSYIKNRIEQSLHESYILSDIPKSYFLYPLLGKSLYDYYPKLEKYWDLQKNKITLKQVSKSEPTKKWWKCEKCSNSFLKCIQPVINNIKNKGQLLGPCCFPRKVYIPKKARVVILA